MTIKELRKCKKHNTLWYINPSVWDVKPRSNLIQQKIVNKFKKSLFLLKAKMDRQYDKCLKCYSFIENTIAYINILKDNWNNEETKYEVEQLIHSITLTPNRQSIKVRERRW